MFKNKIVGVCFLIVSILLLNVSAAVAVGNNYLSLKISGNQTPLPYKLWDVKSSSNMGEGSFAYAGGFTYFATNINNIYSSWAGNDQAIALGEKQVGGKSEYYVSSLVLIESASSQPFENAEKRNIPVPAPISGTNQLTVSWPAAGYNGTPSPIQGYNLYRDTNSSGQFTQKVNSNNVITELSYTDTGANNSNTTYYYKLKLVFKGDIETQFASAVSDGAKPTAAQSDPGHISITSAVPVLFGAIEGGQNPSNKTVTIKNTGDETIVVSFLKNAAWLNFSPAEFSLNKNQSKILTLSINDTFKPLDASPTPYKGIITITAINGNCDNSPVTFDVNLTINAEPQPGAVQIDSAVWDTSNTNNQTNKEFTYGIVNLINNNNEFGGTQGNNEVQIKPYGSADFISVNAVFWSTGKIQALIPDTTAFIAGQFKIRVFINGKESATKSLYLKPRLYNIEPTEGPVGTTVTLTGKAFDDGAQVSFNNKLATATSISYDTIVANVPSGTTTGKVTVIVNSQQSNDKYVIKDGQNDVYGNDIIFTVEEETPAIPAPEVTNAYNKEFGTLEGWVHVTPAGGDWQPGDAVDESLNLIIKGTDFGGTSNGSSEAPNAESYVEVETSSTDYSTNNFYWWSAGQIEIGVPEQINNINVVAGPAKVKVTTDGGESNEQSFDIKANVYSLEPGSAMVSDEVTITGTAFGDNADDVTVTFNGNEAEIVSIENGTIVVTVPQMDVTSEVKVVVTVNGVETTYAYNFEVVDLTPTIGNLSTTGSLEVGQTVIITGTNFGAEKVDTSLVRFGTTVGNPTAWSDLSITVAVPQGAGTGEVELTVVTENGEVYQIVNIGPNIYIDDFEGGSVGTWAENLADSGYYTTGNNVTPDNDTISTEGPKAEAKYDGAKGMKVKYSHAATEEASLWGGKLANTLDLSAIKGISMYINWDDSNNAFDLIIKDTNGLQTKASVSNTSLMGVNGGGYGKLIIPVTNFANDLGFDWTKVTDYSIMYTTDTSSETYHYVDNIIAIVEGEEIETDVKIFSIDPSAAPAGTKITIKGEDFGSAQGQSSLIFENIETNASFQAKVEKWSASEIKAVVPEQANTGDYNVRVIKIAIAAGTINAQESNNANFQVSAIAATLGTVIIRPNPFNPNVESVTFDFTNTANAGIYIYDMTAKLVYKQVVSGSTTTWTGRDNWSKLAGDGAYLLRVINEDNKQLIAKGKILVIKQ